jgi:DNA-binding PadR family transcriptional regulator
LSVNLKHVILGFLRDREMHGYDLKRALSPALPRGRTMNDGVLYPLLKRMQSEGLLKKRVQRTDGGPDRHLYSPTAAGRREFVRWLRSAESEQDEVSYDFLLGHPFLAKCLFFESLGDDEVGEKLADQLASSTQKLREFEQIRAGMVERDVSPYRIAVLDLGIAQQRQKLRWLRQMSARQPQRRAA